MTISNAPGERLIWLYFHKERHTLVLEKGYSNEQNPVCHWFADRVDRRHTPVIGSDRVWGRGSDRDFGNRADIRIGQIEYQKDALNQNRSGGEGTRSVRWEEILTKRIFIFDANRHILKLVWEKGVFMTKQLGIWIDHKKAVLVI
jgi:hypothetical protein